MTKKSEVPHEIENSIRQVLNEHWDPLDVYVAGPKDEYDALIGPIYRLLRDDAAPSKIIALLEQFERSVGGPWSDSATLNLVAKKLQALNKA